MKYMYPDIAAVKDKFLAFALLFRRIPFGTASLNCSRRRRIP
jgi:hypothetical protein